ncbi:hypothetical protein L1D15_02145 [Vibrio sp. Isolate25]|uniref:hypothetical protein n=1 Tax=Vibrio sp. Isolate25 TaxID=2908535 RepID=UPI001EFC7174|nr:hypothetical protein [Vibrio sp. Isolate25]MCG9595517.1 hypothetical protein [Vibrio sp. Isolate25]
MKRNVMMKSMLVCFLFSAPSFAVEISANKNYQVRKYIGNAEILFGPEEKFEIEADSISEIAGKTIYSGSVSIKILRSGEALGKMAEVASSQNNEGAEYLETITVEDKYLIAESDRVTLYRLANGGNLLKSDEFTLVRRH